MRIYEDGGNFGDDNGYDGQTGNGLIYFPIISFNWKCPLTKLPWLERPAQYMWQPENEIKFEKPSLLGIQS